MQIFDELPLRFCKGTIHRAQDLVVNSERAYNFRGQQLNIQVGRQVEI
jgi:hypothetical protein